METFMAPPSAITSRPYVCLPRDEGIISIARASPSATFVTMAGSLSDVTSCLKKTDAPKNALRRFNIELLRRIKLSAVLRHASPNAPSEASGASSRHLFTGI